MTKKTTHNRLRFKAVLAIAAFLFVFLPTHAQVTIGSSVSPHEKALLDLKEAEDGSSTKGMILPRVALASAVDFFGLSTHEKGAIVYNTNTTSVDDATIAAEDRVSPGFYYNNGKRWEKLSLGYTNWFYMPSIPIETSKKALSQEIKLYDRYVEQFTGASGNFAKSEGAPLKVPFLPAATDLYYYVTDYDPAVFSNIRIDKNGVMLYDVEAAATDYTFINIIFVLK